MPRQKINYETLEIPDESKNKDPDREKGEGRIESSYSKEITLEKRGDERQRKQGHQKGASTELVSLSYARKRKPLDSMEGDGPQDRETISCDHQDLVRDIRGQAMKKKISYMTKQIR